MLSCGGVCEVREERHAGGVTPDSTHSWRCPAEGAGWRRGSSPHRCCPRSYSAGCRSVNPDANNSHWCSGTCTLHSQEKRGREYKEKAHLFYDFCFFFPAQPLQMFHVLNKEWSSQSERQARSKYITDASLCNFREQTVLFFQGQKKFFF